MPANLSKHSKEQLEQFFDQFDVIFTDCDGKKKVIKFLKFHLF